MALFGKALEAVELDAEMILNESIEYIYDDYIRKVLEAGKITNPSDYALFVLREFGINNETFETEIKKRLKEAGIKIEELVEGAGLKADSDDLGRILGVSEADGVTSALRVKQIINCYKAIAKDNFNDLTKTLGMVCDDKFSPLTQAFRKASDDAFKAVSTGVLSYDEAIRKAVKPLLSKGIRTINYESGATTEIRAAVRRNVMSTIGEMTNEVSQRNHDDLGCNGWEISAHYASAPDHEPYQGKQYTDEELKALESTLSRRFGTLNCGHIKFPVVIGKTRPVYTSEKLKEIKEKNKAGVAYKGQQMTTYEATQKQREIERKIRKQKEKIEIMNKTDSFKDQVVTEKIKLTQLRSLYSDFCSQTGLKVQTNRLV
jgi:hypothetical protein